MDYTFNQTEERNQRIGLVISALTHFIILLFLFLFLVTYPDPPPGPAGVLVSFGDPEVGQGEEPPLASAEIPEETEVEVPVEEVKEEVKPEATPPKPEKVSQPSESKKLLEDAKSKELALKKKEDDKKRKAEAAKNAKEREEARKKQAEIDAIKKKADEEAKKKRDAEEAIRKAAAAKKAAEDAEQKRKEAEAQALKDQIGSAFGSGSSQGNSGKPGDAGQPDGDPDGKALEGVSTGSGEIGGGLTGRSVLRKPTISDNSQKTGNVVIKVCVNSEGRVVTADYTQLGSTTSDSNLVAKAIAGAKKYTFSKGDNDRQCGTIKIKFRVK